MGSGGPSNTSQSTTNSLPSWAVPYAKLLLGEAGSAVFPGLRPPNISAFGIGGSGGGALPGLPQMPANLNQQVAGFTPDQLAAMGLTEGMTGNASGLASAGAGNLTSTLEGKYLDPASNPYLTSTFNEAATGLTNQYQTSTAPSLMAEGEVAGGGGPGFASNTGFQQQQDLNQYGLGQNLNNLATNIYGGNYQQERQNQLQGLGLVGATQSSLYDPANQLLGVGSLQQQQQQTGFDTAFANAQRANQYPFQMLGELSSAIRGSTPGSGTSITTGPNPSGTK